LDCFCGYVQLVVTGGDGGIANVQVVKIGESSSHLHNGYDEVFYLLPGTGSITMGDTPTSRAFRRFTTIVLYTTNVWAITTSFLCPHFPLPRQELSD
jgi:hypothetical protein